RVHVLGDRCCGAAQRGAFRTVGGCLLGLRIGRRLLRRRSRGLRGGGVPVLSGGGRRRGAAGAAGASGASGTAGRRRRRTRLLLRCGVRRTGGRGLLPRTGGGGRRAGGGLCGVRRGRAPADGRCRSVRGVRGMCAVTVTRDIVGEELVPTRVHGRGVLLVAVVHFLDQPLVLAELRR